MLSISRSLKTTGSYPTLLRWLYLGLGTAVLLYFVFLSALILTQPLDGFRATVLAPTVVRAGLFSDHVLLPGDELLAIEGREVEAWLEGGFPLGDLSFGATPSPPTLTYTVQRGTEIVDVAVPLQRMSFWRILLFSWSLLLPAAACAAVATLMFFQRRDDFIALLMALAFMAETTNLLNNIVPSLGLNVSVSLFWLWSAADAISALFVFSLLVHAFFVFPERSAWLDRFPYLMWPVHVLGPLVGLLTLALSGGTVFDRLANVQQAYYVIGLTYILIGVGRLVNTYRRATHNVEVRGQIRWVMWGIIVSILPWFLFTALPSALRQVPLLPPEWSLAGLIMAPVAFAFAISRYRLFDIDVVIERSLVYGLLSGLLIVVYLVLVWLFSTAFRLLAGGQSQDNVAIIFFSTMGAAALFNPARQYIQRLVDRTFYKQKLNFEQLTHRLHRELNTLIRYRDLAEFLIHEVPGALSISQAHLLLLDETGKQFVAYSSNGEGSWSVPAHGPLTVQLLESGGALPLRRFNQITAPLHDRNIQVALPLVVGEQLIGIYAFGPKKSRDFYTSDDVAILRGWGYQVAVAVENSRLHLALTEQTRLQQEIELARQTQERLLPTTAPRFPGWDLAGLSLTAEEVGGDFFGYFPLGHHRLAIAVGDVTGKGMAAALLMSGSVIALASAVATAPRPLSLLALVNKVILPYTGKNQNTALCYTVLHQDGYLLTANAGGIEPLVRRADGSLEWITVEGLPLGILPDILYREVSCQLRPGDTVVFISDGLVEARNRHGEMYGFERLEAALCNASFERGAQSIANHLMREMWQFSGAIPPHDDVTLVVAQMRDDV